MAAGVLGSVLRSSEDNRLLAERGFTSLPLLAAADVDRLLELHRELHPLGGRGFDTDFAYLAPGHKRELARRIEEVVRPRLDPLLAPFRMFNTSFVVKWPGGGSTVPVHQDWSYVDETVERSLTIWIPLVATSTAAANGTIAFVPRSHLLRPERRGATSTPWYLPHRAELAQHLEAVDLDAGSAAIFDSRMLHGSGENRGDEPRVAVAAMVAPAEAELRYHDLRDGWWETFAVDEDFFLRHSPIDLRAEAVRDARLVVRSPYVAEEPPLAELAELCGIELGPAVHDDAVQRLAGVALGGPEPGSSPDRWRNGLAAWVHRWNARSDGGPLLDLQAVDRIDAELVALRGAWPPVVAELDAEVAAEFAASTTDAGTWRAWRVRPHGVTAPLHAVLDRIGTVRSAWVIEVPPSAELKPGRAGHNGSATVVWAAVPSELPGALVLQVDQRVVALEGDAAVAFDATCRHTVRNLGGGPAQLLCLDVERPVGRIGALGVRLLRAAGLGDRVGPICER